MEGLAVFTLAGLSKRVNWKNTNLETLLEGKIHLESSTTSSVKELRHQCMKPLLGLKGHLKLFFGSMESMIEVLLDVYKHLKFSPMFDYTRAWITSRYELIFGLKNTESKLELFRFIRYGDEDLPSGVRKNGSFPARMFVEGKASKMFMLHRFGQMCFTTN